MNTQVSKQAVIWAKTTTSQLFW